MSEGDLTDLKALLTELRRLKKELEAERNQFLERLDYIHERWSLAVDLVSSKIEELEERDNADWWKNS